MKVEENFTMTGHEEGFFEGMEKAESIRKRLEGNGESSSPLSWAANSTGWTMVSYTVLRLEMGGSSFLTGRPRIRMEDDRIACSQLLICSVCLEIISSFLALALTTTAKSARRLVMEASSRSVLANCVVSWTPIESSFAMMVLRARLSIEGGVGDVGDVGEEGLLKSAFFLLLGAITNNYITAVVLLVTAREGCNVHMLHLLLSVVFDLSFTGGEKGGGGW